MHGATMFTMRQAVRVNLALGFLAVLDSVLAAWGFFFPSAWYSFFHDAPYVDPQGLLRRCAANWLAFCFVQTIALVMWRRHPWWIAVVAGCRIGDCLTDLTCLAFCNSISNWGVLAFPVAGVGNLAGGVLLIREFIDLSRNAAHTSSPNYS